MTKKVDMGLRPIGGSLRTNYTVVTAISALTWPPWAELLLSLAA